MTTLTPADLGIIAACMDDALSLGYGDDGTLEAASKDISNELDIGLNRAWGYAQEELNRRFPRK